MVAVPYILFERNAATGDLHLHAVTAAVDVAVFEQAGVISLPGGVGFGRTAVADTNYTVLATDFLVAYTALTAARTVTLPTAASMAGQQVIVKAETGSASSHTISIAVASSGLIDDSASAKTITTAYGSLRLYATASGWFTF